MKRTWTGFTVVPVVLMAFAGSALGAYFTGGGDGTNWSDSANWNNGFVPLTASGDNAVDIRSHQPAGTNDVLILLDATTADGFLQDGLFNNNGNFFNVRSTIEASNRASSVFLDWGSGYTNNGTQLGNGSTSDGAIRITQTGGNLYLTGAAYIGRGTASNTQTVVYELQDGLLDIYQPSTGARPDSKCQTTFLVSGGVFTQHVPHASGAPRFSLGGYGGGVATFEVMSNAVVHIHDYRGDNSGADVNLGTGGSTYFRIVGSEAAITFALNFNTDQDGKTNLVNQMEWIADAGGVSTITGLHTNDTFRPKGTTTVLVDLTDYTGTDDLVLARYGRYDGGVFGNATIVDPLNRGYVLAMDNMGDFTDSQPTLSLRTFLTIPVPPKFTAVSIAGGVASMTYSAVTDTNVTYKLWSTSDLTDPDAWTPTGQELAGTGGDLIFTDTADAASEAYRVTD